LFFSLFFDFSETDTFVGNSGGESVESTDRFTERDLCFGSCHDWCAVCTLQDFCFFFIGFFFFVDIIYIKLFVFVFFFFVIPFVRVCSLSSSS
jgi:hypothetical protein